MAKTEARFSLRGWLKQKTLEFLTEGGGFNQGLYGEIRTPLDGVAMSGMRISVDSLFTVWRNHGDVFACVRELKDNIGSQGYSWVNTKDSNKDPNPEQVKILEAALNFKGSFRALKNSTIQNVSIAGNAYMLVLRSALNTGNVLGFDTIDPRTISVVTDKYGNIYKWIQRVKGATQEYAPGDVLHFKETDDPNSPVFGLSSLEPIIWEARTDLSAMISNYAFFANDATPGAQYILEDGLTPEEQDKIIDNIKNQLKGPENRNKSISVAGVKEIKTLQLSQKDMEFNLLRRFTTEKICSAFGVPKAILNYTDGVNYSNGDNQDKKFWEGTIEPKQKLWEEFFNNNIIPAVLGTNSEIKLEYKCKAFEDKTWEEASTRADQTQGILSLNEVREKRGYAAFDPKLFGEFVNAPLLWNGLGIKPIEDIGIDMNPDGTPAIMNEDQAQKEISRISRMASRVPSEGDKKKLSGKDDKTVIEQKLEVKLREKISKEFLIREKAIRQEMAEKIDAILKG